MHHSCRIRRLFASRRPFPRRFALFSALVALALIASACQESVTKLGILEARPAAGVDDARNAFLEVLRDAGYKAADNLRVFRLDSETQGEPLDRLAKNLREERKVDQVLALSASSLTAAMAGFKDRPIVFALVGDPVVAGAGESATRHAANVTGVAAPPPMEKVLGTARALLPEAKRVAVLFVPGDADSAAGQELALGAAQRHGFEVIAVPVANAGEVRAAAQAAVAQGAQAIVLSPADDLAARFDDIVSVADGARTPVLAWSEELTQRGAIASWGVDYREHGRQAGRLMVRILKGETPDKIPFETTTEALLWLNQRVAGKLGIAVPGALTSQATRVVS